MKTTTREDWCTRCRLDTPREITLLEESTLAEAFTSRNLPIIGNPRAKFTATIATCLTCRAATARDPPSSTARAAKSA